MSARQCPALMIAAPASGQGKTTITAALARLHTRLGRRVRVFKTGPDFIDPMIHTLASGHPCYQLDLWMVGASQAKSLLYQAAGEADLILVEGVMGLYDGQPSSADLARTFGLPVMGVIDGSAMAQTFGALAHGLATYQSDLAFAGAFANRVNSQGHADYLKNSLPGGMQFFGYLPPSQNFTLPERHLGLVQAQELSDIEIKLDAAAKAIEATGFTQLPPAVTFTHEDQTALPDLLRGTTIAIARDSAFSFIYEANLDTLRDMGAKLVFFSPIHDEYLPAVDSLYLPGGYPELYAEALSQNKNMLTAIRQHHAQHKPILAECGGMLYLMESLSNLQGDQIPMAGVIQGKATMNDHLNALGLQAFTFPAGTLRGHTFHYSTITTQASPVAHAESPNGPDPKEAIYQKNRLTASYVHSYFPSNPAVVAQLLKP